LTAYYYVKEKGVLPKDIYFNRLQSEDFKKIVVENNSYQLLALRNLSLDFENGYQYYHLRCIRNKITHSFLGIYQGWSSNDDKFKDYRIEENEFIERTFLLFSIVKAALIYFKISVDQTKPEGDLFSMPTSFEKAYF